MKSFQAVVVVALMMAASGWGLPRAWGGGFRLFSNSWGDVIVVTDMTAEGRGLTPPTLEKPVYYRGLSLGCKLGSVPGEELPDVEKMNLFVANVLAKEGYLGAIPGTHEPSLLLVLQWGYLQPQGDHLLWFLGYDARQDIAAPVFPGMLGPEVWRRNFRSRWIETILNSANGSIYGIIVTAFEYKSASTSRPIIAWQTRIGLRANGKSMAEALPTMVVAAGPTIGRETKAPVLRDADDVRQGTVEFGKVEVIGIIEEPAPPAHRSDAGK